MLYTEYISIVLGRYVDKRKNIKNSGKKRDIKDK